MSIKQSLHQAVDTLPESLTLEEAFERLYAIFKLSQTKTQGQRMAAVLEELAQTGDLRELDDAVHWQKSQRTERALPDRDP